MKEADIVDGEEEEVREQIIGLVKEEVERARFRGRRKVTKVEGSSS